ncbi:hypothetical protein SLA2020_051510, partial [Shorea laevis]
TIPVLNHRTAAWKSKKERKINNFAYSRSYSQWFCPVFSPLELRHFTERRKLKDSLSFTSKFFATRTSSSLPSDLCRHFSIAEIKAATQDFEDTFLIGRGGLATLTKGLSMMGTPPLQSNG